MHAVDAPDIGQQTFPGFGRNASPKLGRRRGEGGQGFDGHWFGILAQWLMYVAKFEEAVYVLHCFQKKTQATSKQDKDIAVARYRAVVNARKVKR